MGTRTRAELKPETRDRPWVGTGVRIRREAKSELVSESGCRPKVKAGSKSIQGRGGRDAGWSRTGTGLEKGCNEAQESLGQEQGQDCGQAGSLGSL